MTKALLLFPHQLFDHRNFPSCDEIHIIEEPLFFGDKKYPMRFHKQKIIFHKATIDIYRSSLGDNKITSVLHEYNVNNTAKEIITDIQVDEFIVYDVVDYELAKRIKLGVGKRTITILDSPMFFNTTQENKNFFENKKSMRMQDFYVYQRKKLDVLIDSDGNPTGGQWSFDEKNRNKVPKNKRDSIPNDRTEIPQYSKHYLEKATKWTEQKFPNNPGDGTSFSYAVTASDAVVILENFIDNLYHDFGLYEDAIDSDHLHMWHSVISPYLNCGLLEPAYVLEKIETAYKKKDIPINSHEGFVRQLIGWREYMRAVYDLRGTDLRCANDWNHTRKLSDKWYTGTTGITPVDDAITKTNQHAYNHHIERLMVLGNLMFLSNIHPNDVYRWFMEMYIDAYDWVMVGNVYGMSQDSLDGLITTKPYFSGSNYIFKMSNYKVNRKAREDTLGYSKKDSTNWPEIWDALYWSFIIENHDKLSKNYRWAMMTRNVEKMSQEKIDNYLQTKKDFLQSL